MYSFQTLNDMTYIVRFITDYVIHCCYIVCYIAHWMVYNGIL